MLRTDGRYRRLNSETGKTTSQQKSDDVQNQNIDTTYEDNNLNILIDDLPHDIVDETIILAAIYFLNINTCHSRQTGNML